MIHKELDLAILWLHIQNVVFVDPRWDKEQRDLVNCFSCWCILYQLYQLIAVDHLARCYCQIPPWRKSISIGHLHLASLQITSKMLHVHAGYYILPTSLNNLVDYLRIRKAKVGFSDRIN